MIIGKYSLKNLYERYHDPEQYDALRDEWAMLVLYLVIWTSALLLLIYYWSRLELWARVIGIVGLLTTFEGPLITLLAVWLGRITDMTVPTIPTLDRPESDD
jgi:hypothetical protein